jgi:hypothetical protein
MKLQNARCNNKVRLKFSFDRTYLIKFTTKRSFQIGWHISYNDKLMSKTEDTKFLGIYVERTPSWKTRTQ